MKLSDLTPLELNTYNVLADSVQRIEQLTQDAGIINIEVRTVAQKLIELYEGFEFAMKIQYGEKK